MWALAAFQCSPPLPAARSLCSLLREDQDLGKSHTVVSVTSHCSVLISIKPQTSPNQQTLAVDSSTGLIPGIYHNCVLVVKTSCSIYLMWFQFKGLGRDGMPHELKSIQGNVWGQNGDHIRSDTNTRNVKWCLKYALSRAGRIAIIKPLTEHLYSAV